MGAFDFSRVAVGGGAALRLIGTSVPGGGDLCTDSPSLVEPTPPVEWSCDWSCD